MKNNKNNHQMITRSKRKLSNIYESDSEKSFSNLSDNDNITQIIKKKKNKKKRKIKKISYSNNKLMKNKSKNNNNINDDNISEESIEIDVEEIQKILKSKKNKNSKIINNKIVENIDEQIINYGGYYDSEDNFIICDNSSMLCADNISNEYENYIKELYPWKDNCDEFDMEYTSDEDTDYKYEENIDDTSICKLDMMTEDELEYWNNIDKNEQKKLVELQNELTKNNNKIIPDKFKLLKMPISINTKNIILKKIIQIESMEKTDSEYFKLKKWIDGILSVPFGIKKDINISNNDTNNDIYEFLYKTNNFMNSSVYGHVKAKDKILQIISQWISNPEAKGNMIALQGPPGIGKTSLIKNGVSKAFNLPFFMIPLGGATDSSYLEGHNYTYEGSTWGRIISILMEAKCMNPIIFFDELDKVSETKNGQEIIGVLTHLTDQSQNSSFYDKYFSGIDIDLSKVLFIFSYNDENKLNPILKDRLLKINLEGFKPDDKIKISKEYLLHELSNNIGFNLNNINISDDNIKYIINNYTENEEGVRELKRCFETILLKLNMYKYINHPDNKKIKQDKKIELYNSIENIKFPITLNNDIIDKLLFINKEEINDSAKMMYM